MTDAEVICTWMDGPKPDIHCEDHEWPFRGRNEKGRRYQWWKWERDRNGHLPRDLYDLNALHEVEARLTDEQWYTYLCNMAGITHESIARTVWLKCLVHATPEQKIKALAAVLRPIVEGK